MASLEEEIKQAAKEIKIEGNLVHRMKQEVRNADLPMEEKEKLWELANDFKNLEDREKYILQKLRNGNEKEALNYFHSLIEEQQEFPHEDFYKLLVKNNVVDKETASEIIELEEEIGEIEKDLLERVEKRKEEIKSKTTERVTGSPDNQLIDMLEQRIRLIRETSGDDSRVTLKACKELLNNFDKYGNDFYHGTWGQSIDSILERGITYEKGPQMTGETGTGKVVSFTYLPAVAFHYSLRQQPNTVKLIEDFLKRNYGFDKFIQKKYGSAPSDKDEIRGAIIDFVKEIEKNKDNYASLGGHKVGIVENNMKELKDIIQGTNGLKELSYDIKENLNVLEAIIGADKRSTRFYQERQVKTRNEVKALKGENPLGEAKVKSVNQQNLVAYVPTGFTSSYRDKYSKYGIEIRNLDSLLIKHELRMKKTYENKGMIKYGNFWEGDRLGIIPKAGINYEYRPDKIQVSH